MPHHNKIDVTVKSGSSIEGLTLSSGAREKLLPGATTDEQATEVVAAWIKAMATNAARQHVVPELLAEWLAANITSSD
jgi:hypothetical protein